MEINTTGNNPKDSLNSSNCSAAAAATSSNQQVAPGGRGRPTLKMLTHVGLPIGSGTLTNSAQVQLEEKHLGCNPLMLPAAGSQQPAAAGGRSHRHGCCFFSSIVELEW